LIASFQFRFFAAFFSKRREFPPERVSAPAPREARNSRAFATMISATQCAAYAGLSSNEIVLGAAPTYEQQGLLSSYLLNMSRGPAAVREMIVSDLRDYLDLGNRRRAADLLIVLSRFFSDFPEARICE
jgi:hypothetical protein